MDIKISKGTNKSAGCSDVIDSTSWLTGGKKTHMMGKQKAKWTTRSQPAAVNDFTGQGRREESAIWETPTVLEWHLKGQFNPQNHKYIFVPVS